MLEVFECPVEYELMPDEVKAHVDDIKKRKLGHIIDVEHLSLSLCDGEDVTDEWTVAHYSFTGGWIHAKTFQISNECDERKVRINKTEMPAYWAKKWAEGVKAVNQRGGFL